MTDDTRTGGEGNDEGSAEGGDGRSRRGRMGEGIRQGIGVLSAFKDALEETIQEARDRGDLSTDRAKEIMKEALDRAQSAAEEAKGKLDFAHQAELDAARGEIETLTAAFEALQQRVNALEASVFGESGDGEGAAEG